MAKTYNTLGTVAPGDVLRANSGTAAYNGVITNVNNYRLPPFALVSLAANASIANITDVGIGFASSTANDCVVTNGSTSSTIANAGRVTIDTDGIYVVSYMITFAANGTGLRYATIAKNGTGSALNATGTFWYSVAGTAGQQTMLLGNGLMSLVKNDYLQLVLYQNSGGSLNAGPAGPTRHLHVQWLGQAS
jgi:hypothetical protein